MSRLKDRVVLVGLGGATCSGKSTIAKHLLDVLPNSIVIHQDDFAPPEELVPMHPEYQVPDWDTPQGAIDWPRLREFLKSVKKNGAIPHDHRSQDCQNEEDNTILTNSAYEDLRAQFQQLEDEQRKKGVRIIWGLVDGFLMYWDDETIEQLDVRMFLRVAHDVLKERRHKRNEFYELVGYNPWGTPWVDPPGYWENIAYPAYVEAHKDMFENGDVEHGKLTGEKVPGLVLIEPEKEGGKLGMDDIVRVCCDALSNFARLS